MSDAEVAAFLEEGRTLQLASLFPSGRIHLVAMWYCLDDGVIWCWTYAKSQKARNLARDPRVTAMIEEGEHYSELRGVTLYATAHLVADLARVRWVGESLFARYEGGGGSVAEEAFLASAPKRVAFSLEVERVVSWDHRKLGGAY
jgi:PPOX class probable F420-dependent enzyme